MRELNTTRPDEKRHRGNDRCVKEKDALFVAVSPLEWVSTSIKRVVLRMVPPSAPIARSYAAREWRKLECEDKTDRSDGAFAVVPPRSREHRRYVCLPIMPPIVLGVADSCNKVARNRGLTAALARRC